LASARARGGGGTPGIRDTVALLGTRHGQVRLKNTRFLSGGLYCSPGAHERRHTIFVFHSDSLWRARGLMPVFSPLYPPTPSCFARRTAPRDRTRRSWYLFRSLGRARLRQTGRAGAGALGAAATRVGCAHAPEVRRRVLARAVLFAHAPCVGQDLRPAPPRGQPTPRRACVAPGAGTPHLVSRRAPLAVENHRPPVRRLARVGLRAPPSSAAPRAAAATGGSAPSPPLGSAGSLMRGARGARRVLIGHAASFTPY